jgi:hypothetical protein
MRCICASGRTSCHPHLLNIQSGDWGLKFYAWRNVALQIEYWSRAKLIASARNKEVLHMLHKNLSLFRRQVKIENVIDLFIGLVVGYLFGKGWVHSGIGPKAPGVTAIEVNCGAIIGREFGVQG